VRVVAVTSSTEKTRFGVFVYIYIYIYCTFNVRPRRKSSIRKSDRVSYIYILYVHSTVPPILWYISRVLSACQTYVSYLSRNPERTHSAGASSRRRVGRNRIIVIIFLSLCSITLCLPRRKINHRLGRDRKCI